MDGLDGAATGVHSMYEERMIDVYAEELRQRLDAFDTAALGAALAAPASGHDAGRCAVELMRRTHDRLAPERICETFNDLGHGNHHATVKDLWAALANDTVACIADGVRTLAVLWDAAYAAGGKVFQGSISQKDLRKIYEDHDFLPSLHLANLTPADYPVSGGTAGHAGRNNPAHLKPAAPHKRHPK